MQRRAVLGETPLVALDVETTGVYAGGHDRVIEIALVRIGASGQIDDEYTTLVNPRRDVGRTDIHGIFARELLGAPEFAEIAGDVGRRLDGAILVGHNLRFDLGFLVAEYARLNVSLPSFPALCTLRLAYRWNDSASRNLGACCAAAGIMHGDAHTALGDARASARLASHFIARSGPCALRDLGCDCEELPDADWLPVRASGRALSRADAATLAVQDRRYLADLVARLPGNEGSTVGEAEYLCLLDRVLEDRALTRDEADALYATACHRALRTAET